MAQGREVGLICKNDCLKFYGLEFSKKDYVLKKII